MSPYSDSDPLTLNSPLQFVVIGAAGLHDRVIVRSKEAGLDLLGFAQLNKERQGSSSAFSGLGLFGFNPREMNLVRSFPINRGSKSGDDRASEYRFCWVGRADDGVRNKIKEVFQQQIADLELGVEHGDRERVEWSIAPVVYECSRADEWQRTRRRKLQLIAGLYLLFALVATAVFLFREIQKLP